MQYEVPSVIDASGEEAHNGAAEAIRNNVTEQYELDAVLDSAEIDERARFEIGLRAHEELGLFAKMSLSTVADTWRPQTYEQTQLQNQKKRYMIADWAVRHDLTFDSPWIAFINDAMPGETVTQDELTQAMIEIIDEKDQQADKHMQLER